MLDTKNDIESFIQEFMGYSLESRVLILKLNTTVNW